MRDGLDANKGKNVHVLLIAKLFLNPTLYKNLTQDLNCYLS